MPQDVLQTGDRIPFIRPNVKQNFTVRAEDLGLFIGGGNAQFIHTDQVGPNDDIILGFGGVLKDKVIGQPVDFPHDYVATFTNSTQKNMLIEYASELDIFTQAAAQAMDSAAALAGGNPVILRAQYYVCSSIFISNQGEWTDNVLVFTDQFGRLSSAKANFYDFNKAAFFQHAFIVPPGEYAIVRYYVNVVSLDFSDNTIPHDNHQDFFTIRITDKTPDGTPKLNTKIFQ